MDKNTSGELKVREGIAAAINMEIEIANELGKPIIAIEPWGSERTSLIVKKNAKIIVKWNSASIVGAIKEITL